MLNNAKNQKILYTVITLIALISVICLAIYGLGYRLQEFRLKKVGSVTIKVPQSHTLVFIDKSKKIETKKDNEVIKLALAPKIHSVIISKDGFFPWQKNFEVVSNKNIEINPIFISQNPSGNIITNKDSAYYKIKNMVQANFPPTKQKPKNSKDNQTQIWIDENTIFAKKDDNTVEVIKPESEIKNVEFYKDRNDVVIFSSGTGVFAIDIDKSHGQNFLPIYKGQTPIFSNGDGTFIYIFDFGTLMQVVI